MSERPPAETVKPVDETATEPAAAPAAKPAATPSEPVRTDDRAAPPASAPAAAGDYIVQVTALKKRDEAQAVADRLVRRGYKAFVLDPQAGSTPLYRVRVGPFAEKAEAERIVKRLAREERFKPWISR
jgi:cell division septation protein DedD